MKYLVIFFYNQYIFATTMYVTHSPNVDLDFLENLNFHVLMFLKVYKHVFTRVRLCSSKKIHINITHIALMLIWILLDYRVNSAKNHVFRLPFQKGSTKYFHFHVFVFLQVLCIWIYPNLALFTPKIQIDTQTRGGRFDTQDGSFKFKRWQSYFGWILL